ncbi:MAG: LAGLIDADG family homing endonuclease [Candidatus Nanohalobium sp.]
MPKIVVGRDEEDQEEHGLEGTGMIGKHLVGENEEAHKANPVYFDIARPHVMGIFGKRGTGKCLMPDEKVLTEDGLTDIRELFGEAREKGDAEIREEDEELYRFNGPEVLSVAEDFELSDNEVVAAYRKRVDEELYRVETRSGREITVTAEHPLFTVEGWENAESLSEGVKIGVPRKIDISTENSELEFPESFEKADYSSLNQRESELLEEGEITIADASDGTGSFRKMVHRAESKGLVSVEENTVSVTEKVEYELRQRETEQHYSTGKADPIKVPEQVTTELAEFMAFLIAEGHEQKISEGNYRVIFTNNNENFLDRFQELGQELFDLEFREMDQNSIYSNSRALEKFLKQNGYDAGQNSFGKSIPNFVLSSSDEVVSRFLQIYYDCEGNVTDQQIELSTASEEIAEAVNYMLLRFGIIGRTTEKRKYASNTEEQKVRTYYQVTVSGSDQLRKFKERIDFSIGGKSEKLEHIIKESNTNVDTVPCSELIKECRELMGADRTQVAEYKQSLKSYEDGEYDPGRQKLAEITGELRNFLTELKELREEVEENPSTDNVEELVDKSAVLWKEMNEELGYSRPDKRFLNYRKYEENPEKLSEIALRLFEAKHDLSESEKKLEKLDKLASSDVYWDEVKNIEKINYEGWVYDLTVEEDHSFTAGFGGILCHNSYSLGTIAEEIQDSDISQNTSTIIIDSMGIYWSMKHPNDRAAGLLDEWSTKPSTFDPQVYIPEGKVQRFEEQEMPYDDTFTINPGELTASEWAMALEIDLSSTMGILLDKIITELTDRFGVDYSLNHVIKGTEKFDFDEEVEKGLENRLSNAKDWGIFGEESSLEKFTERGELSVIDVSVFGEMSSGWSIRSLVVGLLAKRILRQRMEARRVEELDEMEGIASNEMPIVWMMIDEAHQFLPAEGETPATHPLLRWVKIGREPGVSLVLATQQPAKLHPNALSQCDIVLSHRLTAKQDIDALGEIMQTYMRHDIQHYIDALPDRTGTGLILDDNSERIFPVQMRPRKSWHAGGTPDAFSD